MKRILILAVLLTATAFAFNVQAQEPELTIGQVPAGFSAGMLMIEGVQTTMAYCVDVGKQEVLGVTGIVSYMYTERDDIEFNYLKMLLERPVYLDYDIYLIPGGGFWQSIGQGGDKTFPCYSVGAEWRHWGLSTGLRGEVGVRTGEPDMFMVGGFLRVLL